VSETRRKNLFDRWAYASGNPVASGLIRQIPRHFKVTEKTKIEPVGQGEHVYLFVEKQQINTNQVAEQLARLSETNIDRVMLQWLDLDDIDGLESLAKAIL
jgi:tRNA(Glu) U13 pseudouridine synthase TruD